MKKIAILITTFERDKLLFKSLESVLPYVNDNIIILVGDQGNISNEKAKKYKELKEKYFNSFYVQQYDFDCGLSYARNRLVELAKAKNCEYCILGSDSFLFNESIKTIINLVEKRLLGFDLLGGELYGCACSWEAKLSLIIGESFELNFIEKPKDIQFHPCDIVRNFFIAKTEALLKTQWDEDLKLCEHEDFFWRFKLNGYKVGWTSYFNAKKMKDRPDTYKDRRRINFANGMEILKKKYNISNWVTYKNLDRAKA